MSGSGEAADQGRERALARRARAVAVVLVVTIVAWLGLQWVGGALGWPTRLAFLFDIAALSAFVWSLVVTLQIRRARRDGRQMRG